jgi:glycerate dehydrogenase
MKVVFVDESTLTLDDVDFSCLGQFGEYVGYPISTEEEAIERAAGAEVIVCNKVPMTRRLMDALPDLKMIAVIATGYNNVDIEAATEKGIRVANVAGYAANTVPQHTFALILNLATNVWKTHLDIMNGEWEQTWGFGLLKYHAFELAGKTLGIIGLGCIGTGVARIGEAFLMKVLANDIRDISDSRYANTDLDTLLRESDIVTIHCPLTELSRDMIDAEAIEKMKPTALLINTARGGIVNEQALADALESGRLAGAGVDVLSVEPPRDGNVLLKAKNIMITGHSAWAAVEARQKLVDESAENIRAFAEGRDRNIVS